MTIVPVAEWKARAAAHRARLLPVVQAHLDRRSRGIPHPVIDFLFEYYDFPPHRLLEWHPGWGVTLAEGETADYAGYDEYVSSDAGLVLDPERFPASRRSALEWVAGLLEATASRPPRFGCFALHEWAMVYRSERVRHAQLPLRMEPPALAAFVESRELNCSHFDAYRFFTPAARPRNRLALERRMQQACEQPGCLHANMDLYKWCFKFHPWLGADLTADAFLLALRIRELDMEASPYDVSGLGYQNLPVETEQGRADFQSRQRNLADESVLLRSRILLIIKELLDSIPGSASTGLPR